MEKLHSAVAAFFLPKTPLFSFASPSIKKDAPSQRKYNAFPPFWMKETFCLLLSRELSVLNELARETMFSSVSGELQGIRFDYRATI